MHLQLIRLFRRTGRLEEINQNLSNAEKATPAATFHAGLNFCKGLVAQHSNKPYEAIMVLHLSDLYGYKLLTRCSRFLKYRRVYVEDSNSVKNPEFDGVETCHDMFKIDSASEFN